MFKRFLVLVFHFVLFTLKAQCPLVLDGNAIPSSNPYWLSCSGSSVYVLNFQSPTSWGTYTLSWGDGSPDFTSVFYTANSIINHTYTSVNPDTFVVTLNVPSLSCTLTGVVVMEEAVIPNVSIPIGGTTAACAPAVLQFSNSSTKTSETTKYIWNYGDGSPLVQLSYTNAGAIVNHTYLAGTVNCQTAVVLNAWNYCSLNNTATATYSPINIYGKDNATFLPDKFVTCWPNSVFTFSNTTAQSCLAQGNNFQRQQYWNLGNYWGMPGDSIHNWTPWPPAQTVSVSYNAIGTYSVMLRDSNLCGVDTAILNVTILNPPTASVVAPPAPICQNTSITFTNASSPGYTYFWNFGEGGGFVNLGAGNKTYTYTNPGTYTVQLAAKFVPGGAPCTTTATIVIDILPQPVANFSFNPATGCTSLSAVSFTDSSTNAVSWNWDFGNLVTSTLQAPPPQSYSNAGVYTVSLAVTGSNTCVHSFTNALTVYNTPTANFNPTVVCQNSSLTFTNTSVISGTNPITSYTWNLGDGSPSQFVQHASNTYTTPGFYNVSLTVASAFCSATITKTLTVNVKPVADFTMSPLTGCSPLAVNFTNTSTNASLFLWNFGTTPTNTSNLVNPSFTFTNNLLVNADFTITVIATSSAGCVDSIKKSINVFPTPQTSFNPINLSGCSPLNITFTNNTIGANSYTWSFGDGNTSNLINPSHTFTNGGAVPVVYSTSLTSSNSLSCLSSVVSNFTVNPIPNFALNLTPSVGCTPLSISFPTWSVVSSYTWDYGDGSPLDNTINPNHTFTNGTQSNINYTVSVIGANSFGCVNTSSANLNVLFKPTASFTMDLNSGCSPLLVNFTNTSIGQNNNLWDFSNGTTSTLISTPATFSNSKGSSASTFTVKLVVNNINNCKDSLNSIINLFDNPKAQFQIDTPACSPKLITFTNTSIGANLNNWNFGSGTSTLTNPTYNFVNSGTLNITQTVTLAVENSSNCKDTSVVNFVLHPKPNYSIISSPDSGCTNLKVNFSALNVNSYSWSFGDGSSSTTSVSSKTYVNTTSSVREFTAQLIGTDIYNCADTVKKVIKVFPKPTALFNVDLFEVTVKNQPVPLTNLSSGATSYSWLFGDGGSSTDFSPVYSYQEPGEYNIKLIAISEKNCKDTFLLAEKVKAIVEAGVLIPNAFTPNTSSSPGGIYDPKDKSNDVFHPVLRNVEEFNMKVFSRWGELLFETENVNEGWDGYFRGKLCLQDVYVWKIHAKFKDGQTFDKTGDLTLLIK
ncbi:MAG: PKD domain-containing protein [Sphingobacteriaceae bacterium]|nr:PKD domain-containing protein [Sphingobacteriaceae bacterium]